MRPDVPADDLGRHAREREDEGERSDRWIEQGRQVELGAGHREEERREDLAEWSHLVFELVLGFGLGHDEAGHERPDDGRKADRRRHERDGEHEHERGDQRRVREQREGEDLALQPARSACRREAEADKPDGRNGDQDGRPRDIALGRTRDDPNEYQGEHVIDDRGTEDDPGEGPGQHAHVREHATRDPDAGRRQGKPDKCGRARRFAEQQPDPDPGQDGQDHRDERGQDGRTPDRQQVVESDPEADREEQDDDADLGQHERRFAGCHEGQRPRADDEAAGQFPDDRGLAEPARDLLADLGPDEQQEDPEHHLEGGASRTGDQLGDGRCRRDGGDQERILSAATVSDHASGSITIRPGSGAR